MHSHDSRAQTHRPLLRTVNSLHVLKLMRQTKPGAVITAQDVSGKLLQKQEMRVNVAQSSVKRDIRSAVPEPPRTRKDCTRVDGGGVKIGHITELPWQEAG